MLEQSVISSKVKVAILGWYNKNNLGDDLFIEAFRELFPNYNFTPTDYLSTDLLNYVDTVFIGGGSFLFSEPLVEDLELLKTKNIFYIGVGAETDIHPTHSFLMKIAKLIAIRSLDKYDDLKRVNQNIIVIPDLVYALNFEIELKKPKSVLVLPNATLVPRYDEEHYKHVAWEYFKSEFAQALDVLIDEGYSVDFFAMCKNLEIDDDRASTEIISKMKNKVPLIDVNRSVNNILKVISSYETIYSARYHGVILAEAFGINHINIHHHDKLKNHYPSQGGKLSYYGANKESLLKEFKSSNCLIDSVDKSAFLILKDKVQNILG